MSGLRALKKDRTRQTLSETAIGLFLERGFDAVWVTDIAAAAEVSKPTLFRYFPTKEDLVLHRFADHQGEAARVVSARGALSPLAALHAHFRLGLDRHEPTTGLCDHPSVLAFQRLVYDTPSLVSRLIDYVRVDTEALTVVLSDAMWGDPQDSPDGAPGDEPDGADGDRPGAAASDRRGTAASVAAAGPLSGAVDDALGDSLVAGLVATQVIAVQQVLARANYTAISAGRSADEVYPSAVAAADLAFGLLLEGAGAQGF